MDLRILEIASNTENNKVINKHTHKSKHKNPLCGDEMEISLIIENNKIVDMGYQCKSCVYCQASVSLLSQNIKNKSLDEIREFVLICEKLFEDTKKFKDIRQDNVVLLIFQLRFVDCTFNCYKHHLLLYLV